MSVPHDFFGFNGHAQYLYCKNACHKLLFGLFVFGMTLFIPSQFAAAFLLSQPATPAAPASSPAPAASGDAQGATLRIGMILPGPCNDWSWNQAMCEAARDFPPLADGSTFSFNIKESLPDLPQAEEQARAFIADGVPIILTHGTQYLPLVRKLAQEFPSTMFVYGSSDKTPFPNVVAYDTQPQAGSYLMGMAAGLMTRTNIISVIAPVDVNDAVGHARGFEEGVHATNPQAAISVTYTGTFHNMRLTANLARRSLQSGADIVTGTSTQFYGALQEVQKIPNALWVGTAYDMTPLAPKKVIAVQVYDFKSMLNAVLDATLKGRKGNFVVVMSLAHGSMSLQWNDIVPHAIRDIVDTRQIEIMQGTFKPDIKTLRYHSFAGY